jgi:hypothetical protein
VVAKESHGDLRRDAAATYDVDTAEEAWDRLAAFEATLRTREPAAFTLPPIVLDDVEPLLSAPGYDLPVMVIRVSAQP